MPEDAKNDHPKTPSSDTAPTDEADFSDLADDETDFSDLAGSRHDMEKGKGSSLTGPDSDGADKEGSFEEGGFEDWGGLDEDENSEMASRMEREMAERRESIAADRERNRQMVSIEARIQEALMTAASEQLSGEQTGEGMERLKRIESRSRKLQELRHGRVTGFVSGPGAEAGVATAVAKKIAESGAAGDTKVASLDMEGKASYAIYKSRDARYGEHLREDPHDQEGRIPKEWLGSQLDFVFGVDRHPAAVTREVSDNPDEVGGAMIEMLSAQSGKETLWEEELNDDEISRVADYHYLIWESDGHDGQYLVEDGQRLVAIDRGESFAEGQQPLRSEAVMAAQERQLRANPEVLAAVRKYLQDAKLRTAVQDAFRTTFGENDGLKRYLQLQTRAEKFVVAGGIPIDVRPERTPNAEDIRQERLQRLRE